MESHELELEAPQGHGPFVEEREPENRDDVIVTIEEHSSPSRQSTGSSSLGTSGNTCAPEAKGQDAAGPEAGPRGAEAQEAEAGQAGALGGQEDDCQWQQSTSTNACATDPKEHGCELPQSTGPSSLGRSANAYAIATSASSAEEDETQLAAIRELMQRSFARGIWLTLGEIADVTEFAEASISAQLRHLRKPRHGGHRVEKRRRRPHGAAVAAPNIWDARRGPVIWEYRVLPATHARGIAAERRTTCLNG